MFYSSFTAFSIEANKPNETKNYFYMAHGPYNHWLSCYYRNNNILIQVFPLELLLLYRHIPTNQKAEFNSDVVQIYSLQMSIKTHVMIPRSTYYSTFCTCYISVVSFIIQLNKTFILNCLLLGRRFHRKNYFQLKRTQLLTTIYFRFPRACMACRFFIALKRFFINGITFAMLSYNYSWDDAASYDLLQKTLKGIV